MAWFVKIERGIVDKPRFDRFVAAHVAYVNSLILNGHQARSGYWAERGGGMLIFTAESMAAAKKITEADPLIANNCVDYELHEWCIVAEPSVPEPSASEPSAVRP
ncbi:MAG: YciI family protein [Cyanobacteria bacterium J06598_3]